MKITIDISELIAFTELDNEAQALDKELTELLTVIQAGNGEGNYAKRFAEIITQAQALPVVQQSPNKSQYQSYASSYVTHAIHHLTTARYSELVARLVSLKKRLSRAANRYDPVSFSRYQRTLGTHDDSDVLRHIERLIDNALQSELDEHLDAEGV